MRTNNNNFRKSNFVFIHYTIVGRLLAFMLLCVTPKNIIPILKYTDPQRISDFLNRLKDVRKVLIEILKILRLNERMLFKLAEIIPL